MSIDSKAKANHKLLQRVLQQEQHCKNLKSTLAKLSRRAHCPQLTKALSPQSTFINEHGQRLKLIEKLIGKTHPLTNKEQLLPRSFPSDVTIANKSAAQDYKLIPFALQLFSSANKSLQKLRSLANNYGEELMISLIEQSISENDDTIVWLKRILNNVVVPDLKKDDN